MTQQELRTHLEDAIERALEILDRLDGDPDAEPEALEDNGDGELNIQWPTWNRAA